MPVCTNCSSQIPEGKAYCADCGTAVPTDAPTETSLPTLTSASPRSPGASPGLPPPSDPQQSRFLPGNMLKNRYRIVGLLGRGGMGEVYRADDLKLGQPVALKFLPVGLESDPQRLERFLNEVRLARTVSHPNVCRMHDVGEVGGQHYLSMEYVDGEDLASLLRRIGRLPKDKAVELARQLCAGLAAAHEQGILHRDLKPANVMIDGRGRVKITDFGLAVPPDTVHGDEVRVGTPGYMAPEQLAGQEVTIRSDVYALGLVLYELFTGKPAYSAGTQAELLQLQTETTPTTPSTLVDGFDPAVERIILLCLETDPSRRPSSALAVSAALPGGDPLAEALAAGETPSPELVAAQGTADAMSRPLALTLAALVVVGVFIVGTLKGANSLRAHLPMDKPPAAMVDRAREVIRDFGYTEPLYADPQDSAFGYTIWQTRIDWIWENVPPDERLEALASPRAYVASFWYRQSPTHLVPVSNSFATFSGRLVHRWNPFPQTTGEIMVSLSPTGQLEFFVHTPRRYHEDPIVNDEPDWSVPFEMAGLNIGDFQEVEPRYQRFMRPEKQAAWVGFRPGRTDEKNRIEAGMSEGRLNFWGILDPGELEFLKGEPENLEGVSANNMVFVVILTAVFIGGIFLARFNLRRGRADQKGAWRLGAFTLIVTLAVGMLNSHTFSSRHAVFQIYPIAGTALFIGVLFMILYLAVEPFVRRVWPTMLVSWSRLLSRTRTTWRDPLIGRSVLAGLTAGTAILFLDYSSDIVLAALQGGPVRPTGGDWNVLLGQRYALAKILGEVSDSLGQTLVLTFMLIAARLLLRKTWLAIAVAGPLYMFMGWPIRDTFEETVVAIVFSVLYCAIHIALLLRFGLVGVLSAAYLGSVDSITRATDWTAWHSQPAIIALIFIAALAAYGYWASTARTKVPIQS